jgi:hypothetical protein
VAAADDCRAGGHRRIAEQAAGRGDEAGERAGAHRTNGSRRRDRPIAVTGSTVLGPWGIRVVPT